jgi:hypothetical protein
LSIEQVARDLDIGTLQRNLTNIAFCDIEAEDLRNVDVHFIKLFKLAQLMLEYVLFSQGQLEQAKNVTDSSLESTARERDELLEKYNSTRQENKRRRNMIASYQRLIDSQNVGPNKCTFCGKAFVTPSYLLAHCERRHPERAPFNIDLTVGSAEAQKAATDAAVATATHQSQLDGLPDLVKQLHSEIKIVRSEIGTQFSQRHHAQHPHSPTHEGAQSPSHVMHNGRVSRPHAPHQSGHGDQELHKVRSELHQCNAENAKLRADLEQAHTKPGGGAAAATDDSDDSYVATPTAPAAKDSRLFSNKRDVPDAVPAAKHAHRDERSWHEARSELERAHAAEMATVREELRAQRDAHVAQLAAQVDAQRSSALKASALEVSVEQTRNSPGRKTHLSEMHDDPEDAARVAMAKTERGRFIKQSEDYEQKIALLEKYIKAIEGRGGGMGGGGGAAARAVSAADIAAAAAATDDSDDSYVATPTAPAAKDSRLFSNKRDVPGAVPAAKHAHRPASKRSGHNTFESKGPSHSEKEAGSSEYSHHYKKDGKERASGNGQGEATPKKVAPKPGKVTSEHAAQDGTTFSIQSLFKHSSHTFDEIHEATGDTLETYLVEAGIGRGVSGISKQHLEDALDQLDVAIKDRSFNRVWESEDKHGKRATSEVYRKLEGVVDAQLEDAVDKFYYNESVSSGTDSSSEATNVSHTASEPSPESIPTPQPSPVAENTAPSSSPHTSKGERGRAASFGSHHETQESAMSSAVSSEVSGSELDVSSVSELHSEDEAPVAAPRPTTASPEHATEQAAPSPDVVELGGSPDNVELVDSGSDVGSDTGHITSDSEVSAISDSLAGLSSAAPGQEESVGDLLDAVVHAEPRHRGAPPEPPSREGPPQPPPRGTPPVPPIKEIPSNTVESMHPLSDHYSDNSFEDSD